MSEENTNSENKIKSVIDFECLNDECGNLIKFNLLEASNNSFQAVCNKCHNSYQFDEDLRIKLKKLEELVLAIRKAGDILADCNVAVTTPGATVKIPYVLLLTRLNTVITLLFGGRKVDFHFRVEPASSETFR